MSATPEKNPGKKTPGVRVSGLTVVYRTQAGELPAIRGIDLELPPGTITGVVGESGSGKSTLALSLLNAVQPPGRISAGSVEIDGLGDVVKLRGEDLRKARGRHIGYVFQAAQNSLNPLKTVGKQLLDLGRSHGVDDLRGLVKDARELLGRMGLDGARVLDSHQHELSGGMRQRVGIMLALVLNAHLVVLDEPTTALDMITQANILRIVREVHAERGLTTMIITHDLGVVAEVADRLAVMYGGQIVEQGATMDVLGAPRHPYTQGLIRAIPRLVGDIDEASALPGRPPTLGTIPAQGCVFRDRCVLRMDVCETVEPPVVVRGTSIVACHAVEAADRDGHAPAAEAPEPGTGGGESPASAPETAEEAQETVGARGPAGVQDIRGEQP
ncbi:oligopeptide/dipeptide ABC transporter ATP-binding protein [Streptosporangium album]|uniref:Oligopeptide/dipeptide ABC transporter ATP-binding protein n=1 Tax=Streptosporangium album TaxID=47479 RepID=A0A7W7WD46_9ACTN|nr:ABC transporter ATP-binding protein [Streptosporangium album]MBB4941969.1 oligopeptide/dipeptide ABC transporter ATP-binding protein [Streptosporangium album]